MVTVAGECCPQRVVQWRGIKSKLVRGLLAVENEGSVELVGDFSQFSHHGHDYADRSQHQRGHHADLDGFDTSQRTHLMHECPLGEWGNRWDMPRPTPCSFLGSQGHKRAGDIVDCRPAVEQIDVAHQRYRLPFQQPRHNPVTHMAAGTDIGSNEVARSGFGYSDPAGVMRGQCVVPHLGANCPLDAGGSSGSLARIGAVGFG